MVNLLSRRKVSLIIILPVIIAIIVNSTLFYAGARSLLIQHYKNNAFSLATNLLDEVELVLQQGDPDSLIALFQLLNETPNINTVHVRFNDGRTLWAGMKQGSAYAPIFEDRFTDDNLNTKEKVVEINKDLLQIAYPIYIPDKIGILRVDYSLKEMNTVLRTTFFILMIFTLVSIFLVLLLASFIARGVTKPFQQLERIYDKYSRGNYDVGLLDVAEDETGELVRKYANIVEELGTYQVKMSEAEKKKHEEQQKAIERATQDLKEEISGEKSLAKSLKTILTQLRESEEELKKKQAALQKSNEELQKAEAKLKEFNVALEEKVKERTAELVKANEDIKKLLEVKDQFVNQVSHDLRTPLTPIMTLLPLIKNELTNIYDEKLQKDLTEMIDKVIGNAEYLSNIVTDTLSISRLDTGKVKLNMRPYNIYNIVEEIISDNSIVFKDENIKVVNNISKDLPKVNIDKMRIREVINNLISNAIKFMEKRKEIIFSASSDSDFVTVSVKDTGIGIRPDLVVKIFEEFYKADPSRHEHSSGLGLSICKRIIEKHGGRIWAESPGLGKGSTFKFTLPIYKA